jgi:hypothetical protein
MEQIQSRRSSLEITITEEDREEEENGLKLNDSFYSEFCQQTLCGGNFEGDNSMDISQMELSQISGWSAVNAKWDISLPLDLNFDTDENNSDGNLSRFENERQEAINSAEKASIHDLFVEECCELYNDIQNAIDELEFEEQIPCIEKLEERQINLTKKSRLLSEIASELCDIVSLRMQTIDRAMEQLKLRHDVESARSSSRENPHSPTYQLRKWLQNIESKLEKFRSEISLTKNLCDLQRLCADQQLLQLQIETEGQSLLNFAKKHLQTRPLTEGKKTERAQRSLQQLEQRLLGAWIRSLENLERLGSKQQKGTDTPAESLSEDEEPVQKRRRTTSSSTITNFPSSSSPYSRTSTTDVLLIPSSTESECATEDDPDIIPFTPGDYESYTTAATATTEMPEQLLLLSSPPSSPPGLEELCSTSSRQLHDIGYSSGENSIHESLNLIGNGIDFDEKERRMRLKLTPTKGFYKTVPLDDAGVTDTEITQQQQQFDNNDIELPDSNNDDQQMLSESMIVQADLQSSMALPDDYQEVMEMMMDDEFEARIQQLQKGTQWKELKTKRISTPKRNNSYPISKPSSECSKQRDTDFSCEASSEESDSGKDKSRQSLYDNVGGTAAAALPPIPPQQRKRRIKKVVRNHAADSIASAAAVPQSHAMKNSLTNIGMDESVYIFPENPMSQSLSASFFGSKSSFSSAKRKHEKQRIHRSASDYVNLSWNLENISNSFHSFVNFEPLMTSTLKRQTSGRIINRRPSVESFASTTSSGTVQETGDALYEWDDYRDPPSLSEIMPTIIPLDDASTSSILDNTIIDEDFQSQIPFDDNIETTLHECQQNYYQVRRIMNDYDPMAEEHKDVRKALRISAKENVKKLTAIVKALPRNLNMDQINEVDILQKDWKSALEELGPTDEDEIDPNEQMEIDQTTVNEIKVQLAEMKAALKQLLISDVEKMTIADLEGFILERKEIWENLMKRKSSLMQLAEQPGNRYNNGELVNLLQIVDQSLYTIGDSTLFLQKSIEKYHSLGNLKESLELLKGKLGTNELIGSKTAEEIQNELQLCQERMDTLETVCNGLTTQVGDLAALNGNRKPGKQAKFWKELNQYKNSLKQLKEKFAKASIKPPSPAQIRKRKTKEISTNTSTISTTSKSTTTTTVPRRPTPLPRRIIQTFKDSRGLQFLLGATVSLLLGLILISYFVDDTPQNNWRKMFGPQLDYVNGAPPS